MDDTAEMINALRSRFPALTGPRKEDICYATQNRQDAVKLLINDCDVLIVVGSVSSSNSNRLVELATRNGKPGYLVDGPEDLKKLWVSDAKSVGVTAGASAPEVLVKRVLDRLVEWGGQLPEERPGRSETIVFNLPKALRKTG